MTIQYLVSVIFVSTEAQQRSNIYGIDREIWPQL